MRKLQVEVQELQVGVAKVLPECRTSSIRFSNSHFNLNVNKYSVLVHYLYHVMYLCKCTKVYSNNYL